MATIKPKETWVLYICYTRAVCKLGALARGANRYHGKDPWGSPSDCVGSLSQVVRGGVAVVLAVCFCRPKDGFPTTSGIPFDTSGDSDSHPTHPFRQLPHEDGSRSSSTAGLWCRRAMPRKPRKTLALRRAAYPGYVALYLRLSMEQNLKNHYLKKTTRLLHRNLEGRQVHRLKISGHALKVGRMPATSIPFLKAKRWFGHLSHNQNPGR